MRRGETFQNLRDYIAETGKDTPKLCTLTAPATSADSRAQSFKPSTAKNAQRIRAQAKAKAEAKNKFYKSRRGEALRLGGFEVIALELWPF